MYIKYILGELFKITLLPTITVSSCSYCQ